MTMAPAPSGPLKTSLLVPFVLLLAGGVGFFFTAIRPFFQGMAARDWVETPCHILSSEVKRSAGSKGGSTYRPEINYTYQVDGRQYQSDRYQFGFRTSSSGRESKAAVVARYPRGKMAVCYVDPHNPQEAVLDRTPFPGDFFTLFPLIFVVGGVVWMVSAIRNRAQVVALHTLLAAGEPWKIRPDWAEGRAATSARREFYGVWAATVFWNGISLFATWSVLSEHSLRDGWKPEMLVLLFPLIGLGLLCWALLATQRWLHFGESTLETRPFPAIPGGEVKGTVRLNRLIRSEGPVQLRLQCMERITVRRGKGSSTQEKLLWEQEKAVEMAPTGDAIPVAFPLPADARTTTAWIVGANGIFWRLSVRAKLPGISYKAKFEIPVL